MTFAGFVSKATGQAPYPYQERLAAEGLPDVLRVPTGSGKTVAATLPWLYRRTTDPDSEPRWLVLVLPQRALVEQTTGMIGEWLGNLAVDVPVHVLMGGEHLGDREWKADPAREHTRERIFVGTQDMVLSRLLMRGFAEPRASWPTTFGLLHAGVRFVFDEVQLMGPGLPTSLQLQGLRERWGTAVDCRSTWMSATLDPARLSTVDFSRELSVVELRDADWKHRRLGKRLRATRTVRELVLGGSDAARYPRALAERVLAEHRPRTRMLVVLNTVERATEVYEALGKQELEAELVLLHSRFRPLDRWEHTRRSVDPPGPAGTIVVSTQVLEAGVDVTSQTLITEVASWSSIVQRAGRCNRRGETEDARLLWTVPPGKDAHLPYEPDDVDHAAAALRAVEGESLTSTQLTGIEVEQARPAHPLLRARDLRDLFDTSADLAGNDIDVSPFIRDASEIPCSSPGVSCRARPHWGTRPRVYPPAMSCVLPPGILFANCSVVAALSSMTSRMAGGVPRAGRISGLPRCSCSTPRRGAIGPIPVSPTEAVCRCQPSSHQRGPPMLSTPTAMLPVPGAGSRWPPISPTPSAKPGTCLRHSGRG